MFSKLYSRYSNFTDDLDYAEQHTYNFISILFNAICGISLLNSVNLIRNANNSTIFINLLYFFYYWLVVNLRKYGNHERESQLVYDFLTEMLHSA